MTDRRKQFVAERGVRGGAALAVLGLAAGLGVAPGLAQAQQAAAPAPAAAPTETAGEIVVTATRREEALSRVPIAVTAMSGKVVQEAHIGNFVDLPAMVPGATFVSTKGPSTANLQIRGQTTTNDAPALELPVAVFIDDIYYGTLASFDADFFDVSQIAVLRGPQGTTFGRNVVGGALQITDNMPKLGQTGGETNLTVETYTGSGVPDSPGFETQGFFNLAVSPDAAARLAYSVKDVGGYMHNYVTGHNLSDQKSFAIRPTFLWRPTDDLKLQAMVSYIHEDEAAAGYHFFGQGSVVAAAQAISTSPWASFQDVDGTNKRDIFAAQVRADWSHSFGDLTSITSYRSLDAKYVDDGDSGPLPANNNSINASREFEFSQEFRLTSPTGRRLEYVAGLYYGFENLKKAITFGFNGTIPGQFLGVLTKGTLQNQTAVGDAHVLTVAPFAEGKFHFTDQVALTVGGRVTYEDKKNYTDHIGASAFYGAAFNAEGMEHEWTAFTPRAILEYKPFHNTLFYASASTGFKGGGWSLTSTSPAKAVIPLNPERSISYELGAKVQLFDHRVSLNTAIYQADTKDLQVRSLIGPVLTDTNAGSERVRGVEVESTWTPFHNAQIGLNYAYTEAIYTQFRGCAAGGVNCSGGTVPFVPKNDVHLFVQYRWDLGGLGDLTAHADGEWSGHTQVSPVNAAQPIAKNFTEKRGLINGSLIYEPTGGQWKLQIWGKNLTNTGFMTAPSNYYFYYLKTAEYLAGLREVDRGTVNPPREIGATLTYKF
ncbi:TonB-dependent receptor [Phenylobacterium montanum]|uniref:TonB-dependent receptor n=1 Tax=Phenylobacterium montanum TaxID=2823693 RepID=A0A975IYE7_9CAUL|nr:TonB-dependent receptor [Caulobacter sp. S6]QUD90376.1 TonB-dependent receptor [Caulobacter sp. S6]